jgi:hypothetical protein
LEVAVRFDLTTARGRANSPRSQADLRDDDFQDSLGHLKRLPGMFAGTRNQQNAAKDQPLAASLCRGEPVERTKMRFAAIATGGPTLDRSARFKVLPSTDSRKHVAGCGRRGRWAVKTVSMSAPEKAHRVPVESPARVQTAFWLKLASAARRHRLTPISAPYRAVYQRLSVCSSWGTYGGAHCHRGNPFSPPVRYSLIP